MINDIVKITLMSIETQRKIKREDFSYTCYGSPCGVVSLKHYTKCLLQHSTGDGKSCDGLEGLQTFEYVNLAL